jgi:PAN domain
MKSRKKDFIYGLFITTPFFWRCTMFTKTKNLIASVCLQMYRCLIYLYGPPIQLASTTTGILRSSCHYAFTPLLGKQITQPTPKKKSLSVMALRDTIVFACFLLMPLIQAQSAPRLNNTNFAGSDIGVVWNANDPGKCQTECDKNKNCKAWTWVRPGAIPAVPRPNLAGFCALKGTLPKKTSDNCCVSGYAAGGKGNTDMVIGTVTGMATITDENAKDQIFAMRWKQEKRDVVFEFDYLIDRSHTSPVYVGAWLYKGSMAFGGYTPTVIPTFGKGTVPIRVTLPLEAIVSDAVEVFFFESGQQPFIKRRFPLHRSWTLQENPVKAIPADQQHCQDYANQAVAQQQRNQQLGCGLSGPQWNPNYNDHYNWCMQGENLKYTRGEQQRRQIALEQCATRKQSTDTVTPLLIPGTDTPSATPITIPKPGVPSVTPLPIPHPATPSPQSSVYPDNIFWVPQMVPGLRNLVNNDPLSSWRTDV